MKEAIIIFTRVPIKGRTKTRLQKCLSPKQCAMIHGSFIKDIYKTCKETKRDIFIFYTPKRYKHKLVELIGENDEYQVQVGEDLGEKMLDAIETVLSKGYYSCILLGTDVPGLKATYILNAFKALERSDVVLGPTFDKGYYLVGMKKPYKNVFSNQFYGTGDVLSNTISKIKEENLSYELVDTCLDIDEEEDLKALKEGIEKGEITNCYCTIEFLKSLDKGEKGGTKYA
ncbi:TIGR04282 family arsenosugar biosynthesis glycosyltransferase [Clostridium cylindrosporum]|uniref:Glycosyltransferase n=1 Tax=Clostridium cylindrosporum DSM 605 TaxID=1121307 RepID=A0A0J8DE30_CLOCY|nr:TIGR04282 family arsenosugar biosynthesis glycosyltransferase [Clostridium cylindrosporum]KMT22479.1 hypothetical protein CLCY_10c00240 [Clostridium cylindrosporum DSM 605]